MKQHRLLKNLTSHKSGKPRQPFTGTIPSDEKIEQLAQILEKQMQDEKLHNRYATVRKILTLLGVGTILSLSLISPTALIFAKPFLDEKRRQDRETWKQFNSRYLRSAIARLRKEKLITIEEREGEEIVTLARYGKQRILKYSLNTLTIEKPRSWDGRWRLIVYDVPKQKKHLRDLFRETLKNLGFYQLQKSVWLYPYPCEPQITFLREYYGVGNEVVYVVATTLEDDSPYRTYFGLS